MRLDEKTESLGNKMRRKEGEEKLKQAASETVRQACTSLEVVAVAVAGGWPGT